MRINKNLKSRILTFTVLTFSVLFLSQCKKDELQDISENQLSPLGSMADGVKLAATGVTSSSYYLVNSLPSGYVKDGSKDYTSYVQDAVSKYNNIVFPDFPILVNDEGIKIGSNRTLTFEEGSEIRLKASSKSGYKIFNIYSADNVTLYNPVIVGDRDSHIGTSGEWGMGIAIFGSSDVTIHNAKVTDCWGDGIYIGQVTSQINCKNIEIRNSYLRNNRRDGISIIAVDGLLLDNLYSGYNSGTAPGTGINFEPNNQACELKNIRINNPHTEYNGERGMQITAHHILGNSNKYSDITIVNHIDMGSPSSAFKLSLSNKDGTSGKMYGLIKIVNPSWRKTVLNRPLHVLTDELNYKISVSSPQVTTAKGTNLDWEDTYELLKKAGRNVSVTKTADVIEDALEDLENLVDPPSEGLSELSNSSILFAVNCGGQSFTTSTGITYSADKAYEGGSVYKVNKNFSNTVEDVLYESERFGNFSYDIPLSDGTYEVTFRFAEIYHRSSNKRKFNVLAEGSSLISGLDIYNLVGEKAYNVTKTVKVTDGTLNLDFQTESDNAKISAFHITRK